MRLAQFGRLTPAERAVLKGLGSGRVTVLGDGVPGPEAGDDRRVRARLVRWLALGAPGDGGVRLHEHGLRIKGALVVSDGRVDLAVEGGSTPGLDLEGATLDRDLALLGCRFQDASVLLSAKLETLNLQGSVLPGLTADRLDARGDVFLRDVRAEGDVRLLGARIGGDLVCEGGRFENKGGRALTAQGTRVTGALFWREGSHAKGALDLTAAEIGRIVDDPACWPAKGDLALDRCRYGAFTGTGTPVTAEARIRWLDLQTPERFGADFWPQPWEHCARVLREMGHAEDARRVLIAREERQRRAKRQIAAARLTGARLRKWVEEASSAESVNAGIKEANSAIRAFERSSDPRRKAIHDQVVAASPIRRGEFQQKTGDAAAIIARVDARAEPLGTRGATPRLAARAAVSDAWLDLALLWLRDALLGPLIAYGHRPLRALHWLAALWIVGAVLFGIAWGDGAFKPNSAFILRGPEWAECAADGGECGDHPSTLACYLDQPEAAGYPAFNGLLYSLDTLVPVVDLEVQDYWLPDGRVAAWARGYLWLHIAAGWFLALLAVAGFSGLIKTRATEE